MRIARTAADRLDPEDVAWVVEWQVASAFPWIPIGEEESPVQPAPVPEPDGSAWRVWIYAGRAAADACVPAADLARIIAWCHEAPTFASLSRPPAPVRASLGAVRRALRRALSSLDPLARMGYAPAGVEA